MRILKTLQQDLLGTGLEYIWEEVKRISNISSKDTEETLIYNMPNMAEDKQLTVNSRKFNWSKLYGKLANGEYQFILADDNSSIMTIQFKIDEDGKITYDEPRFE